MGAIKKANINFRVYNMGDFHNIYERYFLKPGALLFLDFGWDTGNIYDPEKLIPGRAQWIRDNYGTGLSRRKRMEAHAAYYDAHPPKETAPPEKKEIIYPDPEPKETRYPTHKRTSSTYAGDMPQYKEVWDPTVNNGEGGYVRVEDEPTQTVIPESKATIVDPLADKPY